MWYELLQLSLLSDITNILVGQRTYSQLLVNDYLIYIFNCYKDLPCSLFRYTRICLKYIVLTDHGLKIISIHFFF